MWKGLQFDASVNDFNCASETFSGNCSCGSGPLVVCDQEQEGMRQHSQNISGRFSRQKGSEFALRCRADLKSEVSIRLSTHSTRDLYFHSMQRSGVDGFMSRTRKAGRAQQCCCPLDSTNIQRWHIKKSCLECSHWKSDMTQSLNFATFAPSWALISSSLPLSVKWRDNAHSVIEFTTTHYTVIKSVPMRVTWWK